MDFTNQSILVMGLGLFIALTCSAENNQLSEKISESNTNMLNTIPFTDTVTSLEAINIGEYELADKINIILKQPAPENFQPTGIDREYYLDIAESIVRMAAHWVDEQGRVIDPVIHREHGQTSPRFASPGAVLLHFGRVQDLQETIFRTMTYCCDILPSGQARDKSPDFWMRELITAYLALQSVADEEHLQKWAAGLSAVEPEKIYARVDPDGDNIVNLANWVIYAAGGESMRQAAGLKPDRDFIWGDQFYDKYVGGQFSLFTTNGMYRDPHDPFTYDITTRLQIASGLAFGYEGQFQPQIEELLRRGGLTTLMFTSPQGYCPYGGRSAAFHFREAIITALCELEAARYKNTNPRLAGAHKRQARLSAISVDRWLTMKPLRHIKNSFHPDTRHGIDTYGHYSVYSLLTASFMSLAAIYADDAIPEQPCPAETGGFAFELTPAFHKIFANCQDTYIEIDSAADQRYDATGLGRFTARGIPLELGLGMPFAAKEHQKFLVAENTTPPTEPTAIGPAWQENNQWQSLASLGENLEHTFKIISESSDEVQFDLHYTADQTQVLQNYLLKHRQLTIKTSILQNDTPVRQLRFIVPLLVTDGQNQSMITLNANHAVVNYLGHTYQVTFDEKAAAILGDEIYVNRMGQYRSLIIESPGDALTVNLQLQ